MQRIVGRLWVAFVGLGIVAALGSLVLGAIKSDPFDPFPGFGVTFSVPNSRITAVGVLLWIGSIVILYRAAARAEKGAPALIVLGLFSALLLWCASFGWSLTVPIANALFDRSSITTVPVIVRDLQAHTFHGVRFGQLTNRVAVVSRADHPDERIDINWAGCPIRSARDTSPFASLRIGRGALGVPWISFPILCRPLAISDRPLYGSITLGKGHPVIVTVLDFGDVAVDDMAARSGAKVIRDLDGIIAGHADADRSVADEVIVNAGALGQDLQDQLRVILTPLLNGAPALDAVAAAQRGRELVQGTLLKNDQLRSFNAWRQAASVKAPDMPIVVIWKGDPGNRLGGYRCSRCVPVSGDEIDLDIYHLFTGPTSSQLGDPRILLADESGRRAFEASLSNTAQVATFAERLSASMESTK